MPPIERTTRTIYSINPADHSIVLDDGTRLWVSEGQFADLSLGAQVQASSKDLEPIRAHHQSPSSLPSAQSAVAAA